MFYRRPGKRLTTLTECFLKFLKVCKRWLQSVVSVPIIWSVQGAASPVVEDNPTPCLAAEYGVASWRAHPAGAP